MKAHESTDDLRARAVARLSPLSTAVVVVDMQYDFLDPSSPIAASDGPEIVPAAVRLLALARETGTLVVHVVTSHREGDVDYGRQRELEPPHCVEGTRGAEIVEGVRPVAGEPVVLKRRYDGFFETDLRLLLADRHVVDLLFAGACTELCVASTAYHAKSLDFRVFFVRDCLSGLTPERHEAGLLCFEPYIGWVVGLDDVRRPLAEAALNPVGTRGPQA